MTDYEQATTTGATAQDQVGRLFVTIARPDGPGWRLRAATFVAGRNLWVWTWEREVPADAPRPIAYEIEITHKKHYHDLSPDLCRPEGEGWRCIGTVSTPSHIVWTWERAKP